MKEKDLPCFSLVFTACSLAVILFQIIYLF